MRPVKSKKFLERAAKAAVLKFFLRKRTPRVIISELALDKWQFRADLVVGGASFCAFEIKTEADRLVRLERQLQAYSCIFDRVYAVVASKHVARTREIAPSFIGILELVPRAQRIEIRVRRTAKESPKRDKRAMLRILPVTELRKFLRSENVGCPTHFRRQDLEAAAALLDAKKVRARMHGYLGQRFGPTTKTFLKMGRRKAVSEELLNALRIWPARTSEQGQGAILSWATHVLRGVDADVPSDIQRMLRPSASPARVRRS